MAINPTGYFDWAVIHTSGPRDKIYSARNAMNGLIFHSAEGWLAGSESRILDTSRDSNGRYTPNAAASWIGFIGLDGQLTQYYPIWASTWTSGNRAANTQLCAFEFEGTVTRGLVNDRQAGTAMRIIEDFEAYRHIVISRQTPERTLWEHREVWNWAAINGGPTACPSDRMQPIYDILTAQEERPSVPEPTPEPDEIDMLNKYLRMRFQLAGLAFATNAQGEQQMLRAHEILVREGVLPAA